MKKLFLSAALAIGCAGAAAAADLPGRVAPPAFAPAPAFNWSGFYVGAHGGYMWSDAEVKLVDVGGMFLPTDIQNGVFLRTHDLDRDAVLGGVQAGYNFQSGMFVLGVEADISWFGNQNRKEFTIIDPAAPPWPFAGLLTSSTYHSELEALGTVRARVGIALDRTLVYVTGGLAGGEVENSFGIGIPAFAYNKSWSKSDTEWGWAVGGGVEYALTNHISLKGEYLYYDLGDRTIHATDSVTPGFGAEFIKYEYNNSGNLVRGGLNFKF